jgi:hypothetical protein
MTHPPAPAVQPERIALSMMSIHDRRVLRDALPIADRKQWTNEQRTALQRYEAALASVLASKDWKHRR